MTSQTRSARCACCDCAQICRRLKVPEMYFGTKESFIYNECEVCHSLTIELIPPDLSRHYSYDGYGGHQGASVLPGPASWLRRFARNRRTDFLLHGRDFWGRVFNSVSRDYFPYPWSWLRSARVSRQSRILDIGCGGGALLKCLHAYGFLNLKGVDGFLENEVSLQGLEIRRQDVMQTRGEFDFIMLHHSFEHMPNPLEALLHIAGLLAPDGVILIRTPVADCEAFHMFNENWYAIDAPRHLFLPSLRGMDALADKAGLTVFVTDFDSTTSQFVASEGYRLGLTMIMQREKGYSHISPEQLQEYSTLTKGLNASHTGDQAAFLLRRK